MRKRIDQNLSHPALVTVIAAVLFGIMSLHWWRPGSVIMQGDSVYFPDPFVQLQTSLGAWNHVSAFTGVYSQTSSYTFLLIITGFLQKIVGYSFSQIIFLWGLLFSAWVGAFRLARRFEVSVIASSLAAWLYVVNPWSEQFYTYNYQLEILTIFIPFIAMWLIDGAKTSEKKITYPLILFAVFPASVFGINPALLALTLFCLVPFIPIALMFTSDHLRFLKKIITAAFFALIASSWWLLPMVWADLHSVVTAQLSPMAWSWVTAHSSLLDNFRFEPTWWWKASYVPYCDFIDRSPILYTAQFSLISLVFAALIFEKEKRRRGILLYSTSVALFALWISKGYHEPLSFINELLYHFPGAFFFREPTTKAPLLALAILIVPSAFGIDQLANCFSRQSIRARSMVFTIIAFFVMLAGFPAMSGLLFHEETDEVPGLYSHLPSYWQEMAHDLNADSTSGSVLMLPYEQFYQVNYGWFYGADSIADWMLKRPVIHLGTGSYSYTEGAAEQSLEAQLTRSLSQKDPSILRLLSNLGVRYILIRGDVFVRPDQDVRLADLPNSLRAFPRKTYGALTVIFLPFDNDHAFFSHDVKITSRKDLDAGLLTMLSASDGWMRMTTPMNATFPREIYNERNPQRQEQNIVATAGHIAEAKVFAKTLFWNKADGIVNPVSITSSYSYFEKINLNQGYAVPQILSQVYDEATHHREYVIFNPSDRPMHARMRISVHMDGPTKFQIKTLDSHASIISSPRSLVDWIAFSSIIIPPGQSTIVLDWQATKMTDTSAALPADGRFFLGALSIQPTSLCFAPKVTPEFVVSLPEMTSHKVIGTLPINATLAEIPDFSINLGDRAMVSFLGAIWEVQRGKTTYLIYQHAFASNYVVSAASYIQDAFQQLGMPLQHTEISSIRIKRLAIDIGRYQKWSDGTPDVVSLNLIRPVVHQKIRSLGLVPNVIISPSLGALRLVSSNLSGIALPSLISAHVDTEHDVSMEIFSPYLHKLNVNLDLSFQKNINSRQLTLAPGLSFVRFPVSLKMENAYKSGAVLTRLRLATLPNLTTLTTRPLPKVEFSSALRHYIVGIAPINTLLDDIDGAQISIIQTKTTIPVYLGFIWDVQFRGKEYLIYQHEFRSGLNLDVIPAIKNALQEFLPFSGKQLDSVRVLNVGVDIAQYGQATQGNVHLESLSVTALAHSVSNKRVILPYPLRYGTIQIKMCSHASGSVGLSTFDTLNHFVSHESIATGSISLIAPDSPKFGFPINSAIPVQSIAFDFSGPLAEIGLMKNCKIDLSYIEAGDLVSASLTTDGHRYPLIASSGSAHLSENRGHNITLDAGPVNTEFVALSSHSASSSPTRLSLRRFPLQVLTVTQPASTKVGVIVVPEGYDPLWIGVAFKGILPTLLAHYQVNGWANGYLAPSSGNVIIVNLFIFVQVIAGSISLFLAGYALRGLFRARLFSQKLREDQL